MVRTIDAARKICELSPEAEALLASAARPIVLALARAELPGVAPGNRELGVMLPYAPLHYVLFEAGAPEVLVMTSANRSSEPIAYLDADARQRLSGLADAFLIGERPIARRVDDSVARSGAFGPVILRRSRGYAPGAVATLPVERPILAVGADLKNTITLVVDGQAFVSQHIGDLDHYEALESFQQTIQDLVSMYEVNWDDLLVIHDLHPQYASTSHTLGLPATRKLGVQHGGAPGRGCRGSQSGPVRGWFPVPNRRPPQARRSAIPVSTPLPIRSGANRQAGSNVRDHFSWTPLRRMRRIAWLHA
jgi:hydrogenase maturation protein HypF